MHNTVQKTGVGRAYACSGDDGGAACQKGARFVGAGANTFSQPTRGQNRNDVFFYFRPSSYCESAILATIHSVVRGDRSSPRPPRHALGRPPPPLGGPIPRHPAYHAGQGVRPSSQGMRQDRSPLSGGPTRGHTAGHAGRGVHPSSQGTQSDGIVFPPQPKGSHRAGVLLPACHTG
jgi:hypothetical protein